MKKFILISYSLVLFSCSENKTNVTSNKADTTAKIEDNRVLVSGETEKLALLMLDSNTNYVLTQLSITDTVGKTFMAKMDMIKFKPTYLCLKTPDGTILGFENNRLRAILP